MVEIAYEDFTADELEKLLNDTFQNERGVYRTCLTIYSGSNRTTNARRSTAVR